MSLFSGSAACLLRSILEVVSSLFLAEHSSGIFCAGILVVVEFCCRSGGVGFVGFFDSLSLRCNMESRTVLQRE